MDKKIVFVLGACLAFALVAALWQPVGAQESKPAVPVVSATGTAQQKTFGTVGDVHYVDFKAKGESTIVVKDNNDETVKVSLKDIRPDAKILVTYRKEKDAKGNEQNVLISLSVLRPVPDKKGK